MQTKIIDIKAYLAPESTTRPAVPTKILAFNRGVNSKYIERFIRSDKNLFFLIRAHKQEYDLVFYIDLRGKGRISKLLRLYDNQDELIALCVPGSIKRYFEQEFEYQCLVLDIDDHSYHIESIM